MRSYSLLSGFAGLVVVVAWSAVVTAETPSGAKPKVEAPARETPLPPEQRRPGTIEPPAIEDDGAVPDWRGCPYVGRTLELIV